MGSLEHGRVLSSTTAKKRILREFFDNHAFGVVKVGLLQLAKPEVISQHIISAKTKT